MVLPKVTESVLLGAGMLGAYASGDFPSIQVKNYSTYQVLYIQNVPSTACAN